MNARLNDRPTDLEVMRREEQRLALLRWLHALPTYTANEELARLYLTAVGLVADRADLRGRLKELGDADLLTVRMEGPLMVITLTRRGGDVAQGVTSVEGVRRPGPECPY